MYEDKFGEVKVTDVGSIDNIKAVNVQKLMGLPVDEEGPIFAFMNGESVGLPRETPHIVDADGRVQCFLLFSHCSWLPQHKCDR